MIAFIKKSTYDALIEKILYVTYFIHQFTFVFSASQLSRALPSLNKLLDVIMILTFLVIILGDFYYFLRGKFSVKEIIIYILIAIPLLISFMHYRVVMVFANIFAISCFKNVDVKKILKVYLIATIAGCVLNVLISIFTKYTFNQETARYGVTRIRYGLGFYWVTFLSHYFYSIVFIYILYKQKLTNVDYVWIMIINILLFVANDTKAVFLFTILLLIIEFILNRKYNEIIYNIFGVMTMFSFILGGLTSFLLSYFYDETNKIMYRINEILSGRLALMHRGLERWGFNLWGQTIPIKETGNTIDSSMVSMLMQNGLIVYIICIGFMTYFAYLAYKKKCLPVLIALFAVAIRSAFDLGFMALQFGPVVVLFYLVLNSKEIEKINL